MWPSLPWLKPRVWAARPPWNARIPALIQPQQEVPFHPVHQVLQHPMHRLLSHWLPINLYSAVRRRGFRHRTHLGRKLVRGVEAAGAQLAASHRPIQPSHRPMISPSLIAWASTRGAASIQCRRRLTILRLTGVGTWWCMGLPEQDTQCQAKKDHEGDYPGDHHLDQAIH